jgi:hypothetical protein
VNNWQYKIRAYPIIHTFVSARRGNASVVAVKTAVDAIYFFIGGSQKCDRPPVLHLPKLTH